MTAHDMTMTNGDVEIAPGIVPRDLVFGISANAQRHWYGGEPIQTAMLDSFSIFLPEGERFFIRSLKHYAATSNDDALRAEIKGYAAQEAFHTREHEDYNAGLAKLGYDVAGMEMPIRRLLRSVKDPLHRLAVTCAIEHITASLSIATLRAPERLEDAAPAYRRLWMWHALEELEHAAVALDVFEAATAHRSRVVRYFIRVGAMNATLLPLIVFLVRNLRSMAKHDGLALGPRYWGRFLKSLFVKPGYCRLGFPSFIRYYSPWFDPKSTRNDALVEKGRALLKADMGEIPG